MPRLVLSSATCSAMPERTLWAPIKEGFGDGREQMLRRQRVVGGHAGDVDGDNERCTRLSLSSMVEPPSMDSVSAFGSSSSALRRAANSGCLSENTTVAVSNRAKRAIARFFDSSWISSAPSVRGGRSR